MAWQSHTEVRLFSNSSNTNGEAPSLTLGVCSLLLFPVILVILYLMLFVHKTYKTTFQRLIIYYIALSLWFDVSVAMLIVGAFINTDGKWICITQKYLLISSQFAWHTYITAIINFSLLLTICSTRVRGKPLSKRSSKCVECICILSAVTTGLTIASVEQIYSHIHNVKCLIMDKTQFFARFWGASLSIFFGLDLEVILVSISLCIISCFIRQRIRNRQTAVLLRNSVIHIVISATIMGLDSFRTAYNVYSWSRINYSREISLDPTIADIFLVWDVIFMLAIGVSVITQAILCIQTSTQGKTCCKCCSCLMNHSQRYAAVDGKDTAATNPASSRVSQPSYTNFPVPYTGGFTTQASASTENHEKHEQRPLIGCVN